MKKIILLLTAALLFEGIMNAQEQKLNTSEVISSGCLSRSLEETESALPTIVLKKEENTLSVQLLNYEGNCGTTDFKIDNKVDAGNDVTTCSLNVNVTPVISREADCTCPFNISFTVFDLNTNSFYLTCWWYEGQIELTEGEPLVLVYRTEDVVIDGLKYRLLRITHQAKLLYQNTWDDKLKTLRIPSEVEYDGEKYTVTSVNQSVFGSNSSITKIIIPKTIKNTEFGSTEGITFNPFSSCISVESMEVEEDNPVLCSVDGVLFNKEKALLIAYPPCSLLESYTTISDKVKEIANGAFFYNQNLKKIVLGDNIEKLGDNLFYKSKKLENVILPSKIRELPYNLFLECKKMKAVMIPTEVALINGGAFQECSSLDSIFLPESIDSIGLNVFWGCTSLKNIVLSPKLKIIPDNTFRDCINLQDVIVPHSVTSVGSSAFQNCQSLRSLDLPESVESIGRFAFADCHFESLYIRGIIPDKRIEKLMFSRMDTQTIVYVPDSEVQKYKELYGGPIYPLSSANQQTAIHETFLTGGTSRFFDLLGRPVKDAPKHGIYVKDGRKVIR